jgi:uncharacterized protein (TIGR03067 family)
VIGLFARSLMPWLILVAVLTLTSCGKVPEPQAEPTPDPSKPVPQLTPPSVESELAKFHGDWRALSINVNGKQSSPAVVREYLNRYEGTKYTNLRNGKVFSKGSFSINPTKSPAWFDMAEDTNITVYGIYRFDGDKLTICMHEKQRPTTFEPPPGRGYFLLVLEPDKPLQTDFPENSLTPEHLAAAKDFQGEWANVAYHGNGVDTPVPQGREVPSSFEGNKEITVNPFNVHQEIEYRLDPTKTPKQIDRRFTGGAMGPWISKGIYKLEGDTLTICYGGPKIARPTEFTTQPKDGLMMLVLKRVK